MALVFFGRLVLLAALCPSAARAATINLQVYGGSRAASFVAEKAEARGTGTELVPRPESALEASDRFAGVEVGVSALTQPLMGLPVSVGVFTLQQRLSGRAASINDRISGVEAGGEAMAWVPLGIIEPFVRTGMSFYSQHRYTAELEELASSRAGASTIEMDGKLRGVHGAGGLRFRSMPGLGAFVQAEFARQSFRFERASISREGQGYLARTDEMPSAEVVSRALMLGIDLGL